MLELQYYRDCSSNSGYTLDGGVFNVLSEAIVQNFDRSYMSFVLLMSCTDILFAVQSKRKLAYVMKNQSLFDAFD